MTTNICDSCNNAARDEVGSDLDEVTAEMLLTELGADILDHICDSPDNGSRCDCDCNRRRQRG